MKHIKYILLVILLYAFGWHTAVAQDNLSLADAIRIGLENNYQIRISQANTEIASNNNTIGQAGMLPSLSASAFSSLRHDDGFNINTQSNLVYNTNRTTPSLTLNWTIFGGFAAQISKKNLNLLEETSLNSGALVVENTIQAIILGYYNVLLQQNRLQVLKELMELSRDRYQYVSDKKAIGNAVTYDLLQAKNAYLSDSSNYLMQIANLKTAQMNFNKLLAVDENIEYTLTDAFDVNVEDLSYDQLLQNMMQNNKTLRTQYINQKILTNNVGLAKSALYPRLGLSSGYDYSNSTFKFENTDPMTTDGFDYYLNFSLNFNLFNGGITRTAIQNAKISEDIGNLQIEDVKQNMTTLLHSNYEYYNAHRQMYLVASENLKATKLNLDISTDKYKNGLINSFNYRDIQNLYLNTSFYQLQAIYNLIQTKTELLRLSGGIISEYDASAGK